MKRDILALRPNCLLTRYPILFINPPKSLFHRAGLAETFLKKRLLAHGYQADEITLPFTAQSQKLIEFIQNALKGKKTKNYHFVTTHTYLPILLSSLVDSETKASSITSTLPNSENPTPIDKVLNYKVFSQEKTPILYKFHLILLKKFSLPFVDYSLLLPHNDQEISDRFLDHFIELAEDDYCKSLN